MKEPVRLLVRDVYNKSGRYQHYHPSKMGSSCTCVIIKIGYTSQELLFTVCFVLGHMCLTFHVNHGSKCQVIEVKCD